MKYRRFSIILYPSVILYHTPRQDGINSLISLTSRRKKQIKAYHTLIFSPLIHHNSTEETFFCAVAMVTIIRVQRDGTVSN